MKSRTMLAALLLAVAACGPGAESELVTLVLPEGDIAAGRATFVSLKCHACHSVSSSPGLPPVEVDEPGPDLAVSLRGVSRGAIASSIIAPQHVNAEAIEMWTELTPEERVWLGPGLIPRRDPAETQPSRMRQYLGVLTVQELTDLVSYLQARANSG